MRERSRAGHEGQVGPGHPTPKLRVDHQGPAGGVRAARWLRREPPPRPPPGGDHLDPRAGVRVRGLADPVAAQPAQLRRARRHVAAPPVHAGDDAQRVPRRRSSPSCARCCRRARRCSCTRTSSAIGSRGSWPASSLWAGMVEIGPAGHLDRRAVRAPPDRPDRRVELVTIAAELPPTCRDTTRSSCAGSSPVRHLRRAPGGAGARAAARSRPRRRRSTSHGPGESDALDDTVDYGAAVLDDRTGHHHRALHAARALGDPYRRGGARRRTGRLRSRSRCASSSRRSAAARRRRACASRGGADGIASACLLGLGSQPR